MAATPEQLEQALIAADKAGDTAAAKALAGALRDLRNPKELDYDKLTYAPTVGMSTADRVAAGAGKSVYDTGRGVASLTGVMSGDEVKDARDLDRPLMSTAGGQVGDISGTVAQTLLPGGALKAAGAVLKAPALAAAGDAVLIPRTIAGAAGVGGGMGLIQPAENIAERAKNVGIGAGGGALIPAAGRAYKLGMSALEPLYDAGQDRIIGRAITNAAGNDPSLGLKLRTAQEYVPGSIPTVGQAADNSGVASLERTAVATNPEVTTAYGQRMAQQNEARVNDLRDMAGTSGERDFNDAARRQAADDLYQKAYDKGVDLRRDATSGQFLTKAQQAARKGEITKLMSAPAMQDAMSQAKVLMQNELKKVSDPAGSVQGLDYVKRALDDKIQATTGNEQRILVSLKNRLLTTIDALSPDYAQARVTFKDMSKPINQMDVAQTIADKSIRPLDDVLQPGQYARNLNDQTVATATGYKAGTLENTMEPAQLDRLNAIKADLARSNAAQTAGRGPGSDTVQKLAYTNLLEQSGLPTFLRTLAPGQIIGNLGGKAADLIYSKANKELSAKLANTMLDSKQAGNLVDQLTNTQKSQLLKLLESSGSGLTTLGLSAPGLINAQK